MNREIKFRVYFNNSGYIVCTDVGEIKFMDSVSEPYLIFNDYGSLIDNEFLIALVEFTGFHDKNNKPIYEGDVVNVTYSDGSGYDNPVEVSFEKGSFWVGMGYLNDVKIIEVIGNIYENPDLLKGEK